MQLSPEEQNLILALRNTADHIESGRWVLERNVVAPMRVSANVNGQVTHMDIHLAFAYTRTVPIPLKPKVI